MASLRFFLLLVAVTAGQLLTAQSLSISEAEKINTGLLNYRVLGKNSTGILVYKNKRDREVIETYDNSMALVRRKTLDMTLQPAESVNVLLMEDGSIVHVYVYKDKQAHYLEAQRMDERLIDIGPPQILDSLNRREDGNWDEFMIRHSNDRSRLLVYRQSLKGGQTIGIFMKLFDSKLQESWRDDLTIIAPDHDMLLQDAFVSDLGDVAFCFIRDNSRLRLETYPHTVLHFRAA